MQRSLFLSQIGSDTALPAGSILAPKVFVFILLMSFTSNQGFTTALFEEAQIGALKKRLVACIDYMCVCLGV